MTGRAARNGFTLVEMLVSLAILGMVAGMLLAGLKSAAATAQRSSATTARSDSVAAAQMVLRQRIERLRPVVRLGGGYNELDIVGERGKFDYFGPPSQADSFSPLVKYRLTLSPLGDLSIYALSADRRDLDLDSAIRTGSRPVRLIDNVQRLTLSYFGTPPGEASGRWLSSWTARPQPPEAIRIAIGFRPGDRRSWPDLVVRPRATANSVCRLNEVTGRCETDL